jgi:uncharacterized repeat protein (TIGR04042 family)
MPEMHFHVRWPDGSQEACYSPSLIVREYLTPGTSYPPSEFLSQCREALAIASERVQLKYGVPCGRAIRQLASIETKCTAFAGQSGAKVTVISFEDLIKEAPSCEIPSTTT